MLTSGFAYCCIGSLQALTPVERFRAMKTLNNQASADVPWPALIGSLAVICLLILLAVVNRSVARRRTEKAAAEFESQAERARLSAAESRLMATIARYAKLADSSAIFTDHEAFCRGAAKLMQERFSSGYSIEDRRSMKAIIEGVYQKLGIVSSAPSSTASNMSSRQIPAGRQVFITRSKGDSSETVEATVLDNRYDGLVIRLNAEASVTIGDRWRIKYNFGASTLEFESAITGFEDGAITLAHRELARNTNRRRFLRVPVKARALIASYALQTDDTSLHKATPKFVNAVVTEIAGPGLRVETSLAVEEGDKVLVVAIFDTGEAIRSIGDVKHVKPSTGGNSIAVELSGLSDAEVGTMVRLTNMAAKQSGADLKEGAQVMTSAGGKS